VGISGNVTVGAEAGDVRDVSLEDLILGTLEASVEAGDGASNGQGSETREP
jgi:hypothetical protein